MMRDFFYDKYLIPPIFLGSVAEKLALGELDKRGFKIVLKRPIHCLRCSADIPIKVIKERRERLRLKWQDKDEVSEKKQADVDEKFFCRHWEMRELFNGKDVTIPPCPISENYIELMKYVYNFSEHSGISSYYNTRTWDYTARKDEKIFLIEVKANKSRLIGNQRKILLHAKKLGFIPLLIHIEGLEIKMRFKEIRFEKL
jgi:hypothetical protein